MRHVLIAIALFLASVPVSAQTSTVPAGQAFNVAFDHPGTNVTGFQCYLDGKPYGDVKPATARVCPVPAQTAGVHTVAVEAVNSFGKSKSADLTVTAGTAPEAPTNLTIEVQVAIAPNGSVTLLQASAKRVP